jgi:hypothetical protein
MLLSYNGCRILVKQINGQLQKKLNRYEVVKPNEEEL